MDFARLINQIRDANFSDIEIAEELTKMSGVPVSRQRVFNYRKRMCPQPANFEVGVAILKLHKRVIGDKGN
jgi:DNA-directed RNA polymerase specialized sigma54-like protein